MENQSCFLSPDFIFYKTMLVKILTFLSCCLNVPVTQVDAHLRNMRTRFVKLLKRKSAVPGLMLSYTDQKIWERYHFLRPYIQRGRTSATHPVRVKEHAACRFRRRVQSLTFSRCARSFLVSSLGVMLLLRRMLMTRLCCGASSPPPP